MPTMKQIVWSTYRCSHCGMEVDMRGTPAQQPTSTTKCPQGCGPMTLLNTEQHAA